MEVLESLKRRYAVKQFDKTAKLSQEQLNNLKEVLRLSPSSFGLQPWKFILVNDKELRTQIRAHAWNQSQVEDASAFFVLCRPETIRGEDVERFMKQVVDVRGVERSSLDGYSSVINKFIERYSDEQKAAWMERQIYVALGTLLTACASSNIDACPMEGFEREGVDSVLALPEKGLRSVVLCAVGKRSAEDKYATTKKVRYDAEDVFLTL